MKLFLDLLVDFASLEKLWISNTLIYDAEGNVIGQITLNYHGDKKVFINLIAINPEHRNKGYFTQLLDLISRVADKNGDTLQLIPLPTETDKIPCSGITIEKLQSIYSSYGFEPDIEGVRVSTYTRSPSH
ncbi:MAG: GNAT family N-acetyltransferase [Ignavibacteria bacterium]|jgi:GNAT superfamily N-acetyltransferase